MLYCRNLRFALCAPPHTRDFLSSMGLCRNKPSGGWHRQSSGRHIPRALFFYRSGWGGHCEHGRACWLGLVSPRIRRLLFQKLQYSTLLWGRSRCVLTGRVVGAMLGYSYSLDGFWSYTTRKHPSRRQTQDSPRNAEPSQAGSSGDLEPSTANRAATLLQGTNVMRHACHCANHAGTSLQACSARAGGKGRRSRRWESSPRGGHLQRHSGRMEPLRLHGLTQLLFPP